MNHSYEAVEISDLRDRIEFRTAVIEQNLRQWGAFTGIDRPIMSELFAADNAKGTLPVTLIALVDDTYAGCVSLRSRTMGMVTHPDAYLDETPWLSNMWVADWARGHGLATRLTEELEQLAVSLGVTTIFSSTLDADSLYHKLGYRNIETRNYRDDVMYLIRKELA